MSKLNLHAGHRERLRKLFLVAGLDSLAHHNILELLLFYALPRVNTNEIAHTLINTFGSFSNVFDAPHEELKKIKGVGENAATLIKLIPNMCRIYLEDRKTLKTILRTTEDIGDYILTKFVGRDVEFMYLICMDSINQVISTNLVAEGTIDAVPVLSRKVIEIAIRSSALAVIIAHNHPRGIAVPSNDDMYVTECLHDSLSAIGIKLVDHVVTSNDDFVSFFDSGVFMDLKNRYNYL